MNNKNMRLWKGKNNILSFIIFATRELTDASTGQEQGAHGVTMVSPCATMCHHVPPRHTPHRSTFPRGCRTPHKPHLSSIRSRSLRMKVSTSLVVTMGGSVGLVWEGWPGRDLRQIFQNHLEYLGDGLHLSPGGQRPISKQLIWL